MLPIWPLPCLTNFLEIDFQSFVSDFFSNLRSKLFHVEVLLNTLWTFPSITFLLYCKGAQPLKFRMVPLSMGFWYQPHVTFFLSPHWHLNPKRPNYRYYQVLVSWTALVNCNNNKLKFITFESVCWNARLAPLSINIKFQIRLSCLFWKFPWWQN